MSTPFPTEWPLVRLRHLFRLRHESPSGDDGIVTAFRDGEVTLRSERREEGFTNALQELGYQRVYRGDLVIHAMDGFAGAIGVSKSTGKCSPVCQVLQRNAAVDARFAAYALRHAARVGYIQSLARGIRERSTDLRWSVGRDLRIPVPPADVQRTVADFLDSECDAIERLIADCRSLSSLAGDAAATRVEALLNEHARAYPLAKLSQEVVLLGGFAFDSASFVHGRGDGIRLLRGINLTARGTRWQDVVYWPAERLGEVGRFRLRAGDLVIGLNRPWVTGGLRIAVISEADLPALLLQRVACLRSRPASELRLPYLKLWLQGAHFQRTVRDDAAVTFPMLEPVRLMAYRLPIPAASVQVEAVALADDHQQRADALDAEAEALVSRLKEYRNALIAEVVTGKRDCARVSEREMEESALAALEGTEPEVLQT